MENSTLKIILLVVMLVVTLVFGLIPIKVMRYLTDQQHQSLLGSTTRKWPSRLISLLTCFAGGVFLGVIFLDMLPDAQDAMKYVQDHGQWNTSYPLIQLIALLGFFLVYLVEEISVFLFGEHSHGHDQTLVTQNPSIFNVKSPRDSVSESHSSRVHSRCEIHGHDVDNNSDDVDVDPVERRQAVVKSFTLVIALLFHSALEGFAFGVQRTEVSVLSLFFGIIVHKCVVAFSVGMRLTKCHPKRPMVVALLTALIAITSPLFGLLGTLVQSESYNEMTRNQISLFMTAASMGTFLYIAFFEMLAQERMNHHSSFVNMLATFCGFAIIAGIMTVAS